MSADSSTSSERQQTQTQKRKASVAGLDGATQPPRAVKRRASKACQCCRARKVRCNVTEHGAPCTNCRLDEVECIVSESRRKKKWNKDGDSQLENDASAGKANNSGNANARKIASRTINALDGIRYSAVSGSRHAQSHDRGGSLDGHVPHSIYQTTGQRLNLSLQALSRRLSITNASTATPFPIVAQSPLSDSPFFSQTSRLSVVANLPYFIKPLPPRIGPDEASYLEKKGALTVPSNGLRSELLRAYIEFVHPYMPLIDLYDFVMIVESGSGVLGRISLILFQAVMFAGSAYVDMKHLHNAGYMSRKEARKDFFQRTRLLYDFDYESDRVSLVQALLLLTYYYETPDDQKDTWHWMGVATSVAHTIGLHRNPERSSMDSKKTKLWKRIWWSTYMRDRLIALGMRRPTRIKTEDFDVPMLTLDDFELVAIPEGVSCIPADCNIARDVDKQRDLAVMCIEKAKLCLCISHVLSTQYCVLNNNQGMVNDRTTMMLLPKKGNPETCEVKACDDKLQRWFDELPDEAKNYDQLSGNRSLDLHRSLLHMIFYTTLSALHRPQVLPSGPSLGQAIAPSSPSSADLLETSRKAVRRAATAITNIAQALDSADLVRFLPTTGVTVLLPAIIIHLLDIKAPEEATRRHSLRGFCQCMQVMGKLRDLYAAADYSTAFLEAAIRKAGIQIAPFPSSSAAAPSDRKERLISTVEDLVNAGRRLDLHAPLPPSAPAGTINPHALTPPPDIAAEATLGGLGGLVSDEEVARRLETYLASTPPESEDHGSASSSSSSAHSDDVDAHSHTDATSVSADHGLLLKAGVVGSGGILGDLLAGSALAFDELGADGAAGGAGFIDGFDKGLDSLLPDFEQDNFDALLNLDAMVGGGASDGWGFEDGFGSDADWLAGLGKADV